MNSYLWMIEGLSICIQSASTEVHYPNQTKPNRNSILTFSTENTTATVAIQTEPGDQLPSSLLNHTPIIPQRGYTFEYWIHQQLKNQIHRSRHCRSVDPRNSGIANKRLLTIVFT